MANKIKRVGKGIQSAGYVVPTLFSGVATVSLATVTAGLAMTGVGVPLAVGTAYLTAGCASGTAFFGAKVAHKAARASGNDNHRDSSSFVAQEAREIMSFGLL